MTQKQKSPEIITLNKVKSLLQQEDLYSLIKEGFIQYSKGNAVIPPVGELLFNKPPGETHIKYGYIKDMPYYVIKIASGFYNNPLIGLPSSQGLNLLFDCKTGVLLAIILDEGHLTNVRTAVAGAIATKALANSGAKRVGILGTGTQGYMQYHYLSEYMDIESVRYWGIDKEQADTLVNRVNSNKPVAKYENSIERLCAESDIIITTTPATQYLIKSSWIKPGTHITAVGSDTADKCELDSNIVMSADIVVSDSIEQSKTRGEVYRARLAGYSADNLLELGAVLDMPNSVRTDSNQITVADLTGVAVQDLMISQAVYNAINQ
ncbi:MAG: hypothetical protein N4A72_00570 [Bacteroidales bacterium]|jgi:ornithine cyclodeaminase|nr:hypothetical protein [Bacteroidales bacterium]